MPWKGIKDIYKIWLSEIILQQTRVEQGLAYYENFIEKFPTIHDLAAASENSVMKIWEGLGYYSRCRNLHFTAKYLVENHNGKFPNTYEELLKLKGIGPYTAAAIASFGFNIPKAVIDGNVIRVLSRFFGLQKPSDTINGKKQLADLAALCLDSNNPGTYNQAIMDFGATVCKPLNPLCSACPLRPKCEAYRLNIVDQLPIVSKKITKKTRWFIIRIIQCKQHYAIHIRPTGDIWTGLYSFPVTELSSKKIWNDCLKDRAIMHKGCSLSEHVYKQQLTHQTIHARVVFCKIEKRSAFPEKMKWIHIKALGQLAFPRLFRDIIQKEHLIS